MNLTKLSVRKKMVILALGAESAGFFAVYRDSSIFISENFGDLIDENNFLKYKKAVLGYLTKEKIEPDVILTDLHPLYKTTIWGEELAVKFKIRHIKIQHHVAHIFSAVGDRFCHPEFISGSGAKTPIRQLADGMTEIFKLPDIFFGLAMDGTGYGLDGNIWGGEIFRITNQESRIKENKNEKRKKENFKIERIGSLEEQIMIGGDLAVREPARILIAILNKFLSKEKVYQYVKKYYLKNEFEALYNQIEQNFNCQITTSTGRVLDAVAVLLEFAGNERKYKHEATKKLEENSGELYSDIESRIMNYESRKILNTTYLFEYLIKNIKRNKKRLAATAQLYIAKGLCEIIKNHDSKFMIHNSCFAAGGMTNNKIISSYLEKKGVCLAKKIPRGDEGITAGQIIYYLLNNK